MDYDEILGTMGLGLGMKIDEQGNAVPGAPQPVTIGPFGDEDDEDDLV